MSGASGTVHRPAGHQAPAVPSSTWVAHLALVLAAASITMVFSQGVNQSALSTIGLAVGAVLVVSFGIQAVIARRAGRPRMAWVAYLLALAGTVAMVWSRFVGFINVANALNGVAIAFCGLAVVLFEIERRRRKRHTSSVE